MVSGIFVNESGRMLVSLFFWIGKRVTILLPIFFYHKLAQSLLTMGFGLVVTPPALNHNSAPIAEPSQKLKHSTRPEFSASSPTRRKKSKTDLADLEAILEILES
jgi:hypothetical protein